MKMKLMVTTMIIAASLTSFTASSSSIAQQLCDYTAADDKKKMRSFLKNNKLKVRTVFKGIQCNGKNLLEFADSRGSLTVGNYMIGKLPKKVVLSSMGNLTNTELQAKAADRTKA